jgi:hypothetical protein
MCLVLWLFFPMVMRAYGSLSPFLSTPRNPLAAMTWTSTLPSAPVFWLISPPIEMKQTGIIIFSQYLSVSLVDILACS